MVRQTTRATRYVRLVSEGMDGSVRARSVSRCSREESNYSGRAKVNSSDIAKKVIRDIKRILQQQKGTTTEREYLFAHMNHIKGRLGWR